MNSVVSCLKWCRILTRMLSLQKANVPIYQPLYSGEDIYDYHMRHGCPQCFCSMWMHSLAESERDLRVVVNVVCEVGEQLEIQQGVRQEWDQAVIQVHLQKLPSPSLQARDPQPWQCLSAQSGTCHRMLQNKMQTSKMWVLALATLAINLCKGSRTTDNHHCSMLSSWLIRVQCPIFWIIWKIVMKLIYRCRHVGAWRFILTASDNHHWCVCGAQVWWF